MTSGGRLVTGFGVWFAVVAAFGWLTSNADPVADPAVVARTDSKVEPPAASTSGGDLQRWADGSFVGANIYQRIAMPATGDNLDVDTTIVFPTYTRADFQALADAGANLAVLSHPGTFTFDPPYRLDPSLADNLEQLVEAAANAGLSVVIALRTGPGRSEATFFSRPEDSGSPPADPQVWLSAEAQEAWRHMWVEVAAHYRLHPAVVGYTLMVEPNAATVVGPDDPADFARRDRGLADWNRLQQTLVAAIRQVDPTTPILVEPDGWASPRWLPLLSRPADDAGVVYAVHLYTPFDYSVAESAVDDHTAATAAELLVDEFTIARRVADRHGVPLAVMEFGVGRHRSDGAAYLAAVTGLFAEAGVSNAVWMWEPADDPTWPRERLGYRSSTVDVDPRSQVLVDHWTNTNGDDDD